MSTDKSRPQLRRRIYPIPEAREQLGGIGRTMLYELAKTGRIQFVKIGARTFVTDDSIETYLESIEASATA